MRLIIVNMKRVKKGLNLKQSEKAPVKKLSNPIKPTKRIYRRVVTLALNVYFAFTKKLKVTATRNPDRLAQAWLDLKKCNRRPKTTQ